MGTYYIQGTALGTVEFRNEAWFRRTHRWTRSKLPPVGLAGSLWYLIPLILRKTKHLHCKQLHLGLFPARKKVYSQGFLMICRILCACIYIYLRGGWVEYVAFIRFPQEYVIPKRLRSTALEPLSKRFEKGLGSHLPHGLFSQRLWNLGCVT